MLSLNGFHGTRLELAEKIMEGEFIPSKSNVDWLGDGVYFFTKGVGGDPKVHAMEWTKTQSWNNEKKRERWRNHAVIAALIKVDRKYLFDLTNENDMNLFHAIFDRVKMKLREKYSAVPFLDGVLLNYVSANQIVVFKVVKANKFIKFAQERKYRLNSGVPNTTICCVRDLSCIKTKKIINTENHESSRANE